MLFINPTFDPAQQYEAPSREALQFHQRLPGYAPTPLHSIRSFAERFGVENVYVKNESWRLGLPAFKILGASWATYKALLERFPELDYDRQTHDDLAKRLQQHTAPMLFAATDGNHGRAVARTAKLFGLRSRVFVPQGTATARIEGIRSEQADVVVVNGTYDDAVAEADRQARALSGLLIQDNSWEGYDKIVRDVVDGYSTMLWEVDDALSASGWAAPTHVFVQIGNGSLAEAVVRHYRSKHSRVCIVGIEPASAACVLESVRAGERVRLSGPFNSVMVGMNCDSPSLVSFPVLQRGLDAFMTLQDSSATEAMKMYEREGITAGETGAAGLAALLEILQSYATHRQRLAIDDASRVLIMLTEGATDPAFHRQIVQS